MFAVCAEKRWNEDGRDLKERQAVAIPSCNQARTETQKRQRKVRLRGGKGPGGKERPRGDSRRFVKWSENSMGEGNISNRSELWRTDDRENRRLGDDVRAEGSASNCDGWKMPR